METPPAELGTDIKEPVDARNSLIQGYLLEERLPLLPFELDLANRQFEGLIERQEEIAEAHGVAMHQSSETWHDNPVAEIEADASKVNARRAHMLAETLERAVVVDYPPNGEEVTLGSMVRLRFGSAEEDEPHFLAGRAIDVEDVPATNLDKKTQVITIQSPIGRALIGAKPGDTVTYDVNGRQINVQVTALDQLTFAQD